MNSFITNWHTISVKLGSGFKYVLSLAQFGGMTKYDDYRMSLQTSWNHQLLKFGGNIWHIEWEKDRHLHLLFQAPLR